MREAGSKWSGGYLQQGGAAMKGIVLKGVLPVMGAAVLAMAFGSGVLAADETKDKMIGPSMETGKDVESRTSTSAPKESMTDELSKGKELQMKAPETSGSEKPMSVPERSALGVVDHDFILFP
jgi:hypothetical protein